MRDWGFFNSWKWCWWSALEVGEICIVNLMKKRKEESFNLCVRSFIKVCPPHNGKFERFPCNCNRAGLWNDRYLNLLVNGLFISFSVFWTFLSLFILNWGFLLLVVILDVVDDKTCYLLLDFDFDCHRRHHFLFLVFRIK